MQRTVTLPDGVELRVTEEGSGPAVVLVHGFPELGYSWRHQVTALAAAGHRVIVPDMRGYGGSSRPAAVEDYDIHHLTGDVVGLLDALGEEQSVVVGHDWGAIVAWQTALLHPERVAAVCGMSVPFTPRAKRPPTEIWRAALAGRFFYILHFQEPGIADADMAADPARTMRGMLCGLRAGDGTALVGPDDGRGIVERLPQPETLPDWLTRDELDHYVAEFTRTGFTGAINWYRNFDRNWETTPQLAEAHVTMPSLFVAGSADPVLRMTPPDRQAAYLDDLRGEVVVEGAGHWVQQERPDEVNAALLTFLGSL
ncbi:alpha/beta fold hydrolase [Pseudonocardia oroxyli]|uniref:Pimeloyl-ACP methyl ester carboxylesterase n=1 Tax=Pseudonocardia oroxyli TaxID=366584 RepID=A0A1G7VEB5_PSEOR|nr:alpha/beta hydrolase [Pseudonocardia oroxyli]SDG57699.1 Pimeloyl-ACP methyl ester carboxylesterase [Pseudonocardia oroxyli]